MSSLARQLEGYRLVTAQIVYRLPDHPAMLQEFIWQELDLAPKFPVLNKFLTFWQANLDGKIHSVRFANTALVTPGDLRHVSEMYPVQ